MWRFLFDLCDTVDMRATVEQARRVREFVSSLNPCGSMCVCSICVGPGFVGNLHLRVSRCASSICLHVHIQMPMCVAQVRGLEFVGIFHAWYIRVYIQYFYACIFKMSTCATRFVSSSSWDFYTRVYILVYIQFVYTCIFKMSTCATRFVRLSSWAFYTRVYIRVYIQLFYACIFNMSMCAAQVRGLDFVGSLDALAAVPLVEFLKSQHY